MSSIVIQLGQKTLGHIDEQLVLSVALENTLFWQYRPLCKVGLYVKPNGRQSFTYKVDQASSKDTLKEFEVCGEKAVEQQI